MLERRSRFDAARLSAVFNEARKTGQYKVQICTGLQLPTLLLMRCIIYRPIPHREYVESYIKAYYLTESDLERWIKEHDEYDSKHLSALNCSAATYPGSSGSNRNTKQRMLSLIEDIKNRR